MFQKYMYQGRHRAKSDHSVLRGVATAGVILSGTLGFAGTAEAAPGSDWDRLAECESSGRWDLNIGSYDGGLQFSPTTWRAFGGEQYAPYAYMASRTEQIAVAERTLAAQGWGAWPACSRKLGLNGTASPRSEEPVRVRVRASAPIDSDAYTVIAGDTLSKIAARTGSTWQDLFNQNRTVLSNPNVLAVGDVLRV